MCPQIACLKGGIFTLFAFQRCLIIMIKVFFATINIHYFLQYDVSSFGASAQLTKKSENLRLLEEFPSDDFNSDRK